MIIEKIPIPTYENRLGNGRKFGRKFGSALLFVRNFGTYCLSESSAEVRPNRKFGPSLIQNIKVHFHPEKKREKGGPVCVKRHYHERSRIILS